MIQFRMGTKEDGPKIVELFNNVFGKQRSIEEWRWRYLESPVKQLLVSLAIDESETRV